MKLTKAHLFHNHLSQKVLTQLMVKYPSSGAHFLTAFLITLINSCPQLKTRASRGQYFCSSPWNRGYLWGGVLITLIPSDNHKDLPTNFTVPWLCLSHGPWDHILADQVIATTEWKLFETVTKSPTSFTTYFLRPNLELSIHCDCCHGRSCCWLQSLSSWTCWVRGWRLHSSGGAFLQTAQQLPVCSPSVWPYLWL